MESGDEGVGCADEDEYGDEKEDGGAERKYSCQGCHKLKILGDCST